MLWGEVNIESVYFGGGTPSMTLEIIERTLSWIAGNFHLGHEVGIEVNPLDAHPAVIGTLKNSGVSLASLGVQSFNDRLLGILCRDYDGKLARLWSFSAPSTQFPKTAWLLALLQSSWRKFIG
ncbi:MAG: hypothetical protein HXY36_06500, partial [Chloroflexi bacterium]|nr:hypothetical protein [Chloroflexota bacterium]